MLTNGRTESRGLRDIIGWSLLVASSVMFGWTLTPVAYIPSSIAMQADAQPRACSLWDVRNREITRHKLPPLPRTPSVTDDWSLNLRTPLWGLYNPCKSRGPRGQIYTEGLSRSHARRLEGVGGYGRSRRVSNSCLRMFSYLLPCIPSRCGDGPFKGCSREGEHTASVQFWWCSYRTVLIVLSSLYFQLVSVSGHLLTSDILRVGSLGSHQTISTY